MEASLLSCIFLIWNPYLRLNVALRNNYKYIGFPVFSWVGTQSSMNGIVNGIQATRPRIRGSVPTTGKKFIFFSSVQTGSTTHPPSCSVGTAVNLQACAGSRWLPVYVERTDKFHTVMCLHFMNRDERTVPVLSPLQRSIGLHDFCRNFYSHHTVAVYNNTEGTVKKVKHSL
jgi:hypothetical protein